MSEDMPLCKDCRHRDLCPLVGANGGRCIPVKWNPNWDKNKWPEEEKPSVLG